MSSKLQNVRQINQRKAKLNYKYSIRHKRPILLLGPSGTGKTEMAYQACEEENTHCIYWNLSVCERPELQGIPTVSDDGLTANYAAPARLPFYDTRFARPKRLLKKAIDVMESGVNITDSRRLDLKEEKDYLVKTVASMEQYEKMIALQDALKHVSDEKVRGRMGQAIKMLEEALGDLAITDSTVLFDEVEKAPHEILQPLLEAVQAFSINGRDLFVRTYLLTGNLPDEIVHSDPLSHALTNRCNTFELLASFDVWAGWARPAGVKPLILGFLSKPEYREFFHKRPKNNEIFSYSYPTPRGWTQTSEMEDEIKGDDLFKGMDEKELSDFINDMIASKVGDEAAAKLSTWIEYYRELDPHVERVFDGNDMDISEYPDDKQLVMCINLSARYTAWAKDLVKDEQDMEDKIKQAQERARHIFGWIKQTHMDFQVASVRSTCDVSLYEKLRLDEMPETEDLWREFNKLAEI